MLEESKEIVVAGEAGLSVVIVINGVIPRRNSINCMENLLELTMLFMPITVIFIHTGTHCHP